MERKRAIIGLGFLYMFLLLGMFVVKNQPQLDPHDMVLATASGSADLGPDDTFLILQYEIGLVEAEGLATDGVPLTAGTPVYVAFEARGRTPRPRGLFGEKPAGGTPFLKGMIRGVTEDGLVIHYGIESFPVPEADRDKFVVFPRPFDVRVHVDGEGRARPVGLVVQDRELAFSEPS